MKRIAGRRPDTGGLQLETEDHNYSLGIVSGLFASNEVDINGNEFLFRNESYDSITESNSPSLSESPQPSSSLFESHSLSLPATQTSVLPGFEDTPSVLNSYLHSVVSLQKQKAAKERRMRRMTILRMKRMSGQIRFGSSIRYESKRRFKV